MNEKIDFLESIVDTYVRKAYKAVYSKELMCKRYAGRKLLSCSDANSWLYHKIMSCNPFMAARYGAVELDIIRNYIFILHNIKQTYDRKVLNRAKNNAGLFGANEKICSEFVDKMIIASGSVDLLGTWFNSFEDYVIKRYCRNPALTLLGNLQPWYDEQRPWTLALYKKNVLVIHPFDKSISEQYKKRNLLFKNGLLPEFNLITFRSVQTIGKMRDDRFETWFDALDYMINSIKEIDFDIAIIGCGAYGFLLAHEIKKMGKQAVHLGGATQLLFGIKGARWDKNDFVSSKLYNEYWIRPQKEERPPNLYGIEEGCYW